MKGPFSVFTLTHPHAFSDGFLKSLQRGLKHPTRNPVQSCKSPQSLKPIWLCYFLQVYRITKKHELMLISHLNMLYKGEDEIAQNRIFAFPFAIVLFVVFLRMMNLITTGFQSSTSGFFQDSRLPYMNNCSNGSIKNINIDIPLISSILPSFHILLHNSPKTFTNA